MMSTFRSLGSTEDPKKYLRSALQKAPKKLRADLEKQMKNRPEVAYRRLVKESIIPANTYLARAIDPFMKTEEKNKYADIFYKAERKKLINKDRLHIEITRLRKQNHPNLSRCNARRLKKELENLNI